MLIVIAIAKVLFCNERLGFIVVTDLAIVVHEEIDPSNNEEAYFVAKLVVKSR